jgi:hypothetical protein
LLGLVFAPDDGGDNFIRNAGELRGVAIEKIVLLIVTAVITSNLRKAYAQVFK